ncbi:type II toxin-antitoxin system HigB family toxin [Portibacter lacus]|uniref:Type II toxin-antitoxin system HigB family toxin n=1 Tax=Portibacter lacus TaxID=1099794 RepID=A0AA37SQX2_9BACT|nr:type II toxin-antitoxin system HigB family toxin [Portibacter lacus]GLR18265.1 hypothetical protein GCM10007940_28810 [Portibacter lacus]
MDLINKKTLVKLKNKNIGNNRLVKSIDKLIQQIEKANWKNESDIQIDRPDADRVHNDGFYFFDIHIHRTMILISIDQYEARVIWAGSHDDYTSKFRNNKKTIEKWLRSNNEIK